MVVLPLIVTTHSMGTRGDEDDDTGGFNCPPSQLFSFLPAENLEAPLLDGVTPRESKIFLDPVHGMVRIDPVN